MTAKEQLNQVRVLTDAIREKEEYLQRLQNAIDIGSIEYDKDRVQRSPERDQIGKIASMIVDEERELRQLKNDLVYARVNAIKLINTLDDSKCEKVLYLIYIDLLSLKECADVMGLSYDHVGRICRKGIKILNQNKNVV